MNNRNSGPNPDRLKIDDPIGEEVVKKALDKERPAEGWPDAAKRKGKPK